MVSERSSVVLLFGVVDVAKEKFSAEPKREDARLHVLFILKRSIACKLTKIRCGAILPIRPICECFCFGIVIANQIRRNAYGVIAVDIGLMVKCTPERGA